MAALYSLWYLVLKGPASTAPAASSSTTVSCLSLKVESKSYHLQAASKSKIIPWTSRSGCLYPFLPGWQALYTMSSLLLWIQSVSQTKTLLNQFSVETHRMGENICKWCNWQRISLQNLQTAHAVQYQKTNNPIQKLGRRPK